jgi:prepilin-type N-terminal cleavage/methylation domain-containing protein
MARRLLDGCVQMALDTSSPTRTPRSTIASRSLAGRVSRATRAAGAGFTLIELMIVVAIVGILSVIAVVGYRKLVLTGKVTEAKNMLAGIRIAQESYKVERGIYADLGTALCPLATSGTLQVKTAWNPGCSGGTATWQALPVHIDGPVQFGYATSAGAFGAAPPALVGQPVAFVTIPASVGTNPWFFATASADLDANAGLFTELVATSWQNTIFVANEGE